MHPRTERSLWGLEKANHLIRTLTNGGAHLRTRMEVHIKLADDHAKAALAAYSDDLAYPARLHMSAAQRHMGMANWCMSAVQQQLTPTELSQEQTLLDEAVNMGLKAVAQTKEKANGKRG